MPLPSSPHQQPARFIAAVLVAGQLVSPLPSWAQAADGPAGPPTDGTPPTAEERRLARARDYFASGTEHVKNHEWGLAGEAFAASLRLRPHAVTMYNLAHCHRAMSRFTRARVTFQQAIRRDEAHGELEPKMRAAAERYLKEVEQRLVRLKLAVVPSDARVTVDGAPLSLGQGVMVAGLDEPGPGRALPLGQAEVFLNAGTHVIMVQREGYTDEVVTRKFAAGRAPELNVALTEKPATIRIRANVETAQVWVSDISVGRAPIDVQRPAGGYDVSVRADGYEDFTSNVLVKSGQVLTLRAEMLEASDPFYTQWWFWTLAGAVVAGTVVGTYFATRPEPVRPPLDGGGLGWTVPFE